MKVLITGASGFLGESVVGEFGGEEFEVFTTSRRQITNAVSKRHFQIDIGDAASVGQFGRLPEIDVVVHAAGLAHRFDKPDREMFRRVNVGGTRRVAEAAVKLKAAHFVFISTAAVYGGSEKRGRALQPVNESAVCSPAGDYAESKYEAEKEAREICGKNGMRLTILRPVTIVGEGDAGNLARLIKIIDKNRFMWIGGGENLKSLIYKADVAAACRLAATGAVSDKYFERIYNAAVEPLRMREIVCEIAAALNKTIPGVSIPYKFVSKSLRAAESVTGLKKIGRISETVLKWVSDENFSGEKLRSELGFEPKVSALEAVRREVDFYNYKPTI